jgi:quinol monooxygenase YgiN
MIKHIVMWKLKGEGAEKQRNIATVKAALATCKDLVPGLLKYEIGTDIGIDHAPWDVAVYSEFTDRAALDAYQQHPAHLAIKPVIGPLRELRGAVDYEA